MNMGKEERFFKVGHSSTLARTYRDQKCWNKAEKLKVGMMEITGKLRSRRWE
jgi:hypothetical protein